jgi:hypothetical protein
MDSNSHEIGLQVHIRSSADLGAVEQSTQAVNRMGTEARETRSGLHELGRSGLETREIITGLGEASEGGTRGMMGLAHAFRGFIGLMRTAVGASGPIGLAIVAIGTLIGLFLALRGHAEDAGKGLEKTGEGADKAKTSLDKLTDDTLKDLEKQLDAISKGADRAVKEIEELEKAADKVAKAKQELEEAKINASDATPEAKEAAVAALKRQGEQEEFARHQQAIDREIATKQKETADYEKKAKDTRAEANGDAQAAGKAGLTITAIDKKLEEISAAQKFSAGKSPLEIADIAGVSGIPADADRKQVNAMIDERVRNLKDSREDQVGIQKNALKAEEAALKAKDDADKARVANDDFIRDKKIEQKSDQDAFAPKQEAEAINLGAKQRKKLQEDEAALQKNEQAQNDLKAEQAAEASRAAEKATKTQTANPASTNPFLPSGVATMADVDSTTTRGGRGSHEEREHQTKATEDLTSKTEKLDLSDQRLAERTKELADAHAKLITEIASLRVVMKQNVDATDRNTAATEDHKRAMATDRAADVRGNAVRAQNPDFIPSPTGQPTLVAGNSYLPAYAPGAMQMDAINGQLGP